jgi:asparagine synthase (glutamine-hydrolysing)
MSPGNRVESPLKDDRRSSSLPSLEYDLDHGVTGVCGIAGIVSKDAGLAPSDLADLAKMMADCMPYRGPDDCGVWLSPDGRCALSHRRLSIIDLSASGHQPMVADGGQSAIAFNGEIYNFLEIKRELEGQGLHFKTQSDTEVLLALVRQSGTKWLPKLDAMFAFGYYDSGNRELTLARDAFGEKPLYYVESERYLAFASELHALAGLPDFDSRIDLDTVATYLSFQYVPAPRAIYQGANKLPPGCVLRLKGNTAPIVERFFQFKTGSARTSKRSLDDLADELEAILVTALRRRLISDVPLGVFLSGGVDSSAVAALITKKLGVRLKTFSIGFAGQPDSEHLDAAAIAQHLGTEHHEQVLQGYSLDLGRHIANVLDEPNGDSSCLPTYLVSRHARETVKVAISGDGGDEMFGGYGRYFVTVDEDARNRSGILNLGWWTPGAAYISNRSLVFRDQDIQMLFGEVPKGLANRFAGLRKQLNKDSRPLLNVLRELDANTYLPGAVLAKVDRMSMQHSLEVRTPFLGIEVAKFAADLAADDCYEHGQGKLVLKRVASRYLPADWLARPKRGFGLPPHVWNKEHILPLVRPLLLASDSRIGAWIDRERIKVFLDHQDREFSAYACWHLFILEIWLRTHPATPADRYTHESFRLMKGSPTRLQFSPSGAVAATR